MEYDVIIGLEIHAELKTESKMFCRCDNDSQDTSPNRNVCPICLGHPGTLPSPNRQAIEWTLLLGLSLNGHIGNLSKFDRKNYFYPDLPKGYQISQYDKPFVKNARLKINDREIAITRIHLEEDTAKNTHPSGKAYSLIDFNRAGTPLVELVTEPVIENAEEAKAFCQAYREALRYLDISNADMEKGEMRCEANISVQEPGKWEYTEGEIRPLADYELNPKIEIKNINSFKAVEKAINFEVKRQKEALLNGEKLTQETRGWNDQTAKTVSQRVKETSADYRYFPEPDIPPIAVTPEWLGEIKSRLIEMPAEKKDRFISQYNLRKEDAAILVSDRHLADYTEKVISELRAWIDSTGDSWERQRHLLAKAAANWLISGLFKHLNNDHKTIIDIEITPENFAEFVALAYQGKVNSSAAQEILSVMYRKGGDPSDIMRDLGLEQIDNADELEKIVIELTQKFPKQFEELKNGKEAIAKFFVGQAMAATKGKANPKTVIDIINNLK